MGRGSKMSKPVANLLFSSSISTTEGCRCMIALIVLMGDEAREAYESRLLDTTELLDGDRLRRKEVRMEAKERDWKREVRMFDAMIEEQEALFDGET
jgi:hypothetical protein